MNELKINDIKKVEKYLYTKASMYTALCNV